MMAWLYVGLGGALGAMLRYGAGVQITRWLGAGFPYATLSINIIGSLAMGMLVGYLARLSSPHESLHLFVAVGLLGGFTTFSAFSLDAMSLLQRGDWGAALVYILLSVVASIAALVIGLLLMRAMVGGHVG